MPASARERRAVALLCAIAAARVTVHALAFPLFNNLDEQAHYDLVVAYSRGHMPVAIEPIRAEAAAVIARYGSPEYFATPEELPDRRIPPAPWSLPPDEAAAQLASDSAGWRAFQNHQSLVPPLYYAVAGAWLAAGRALGLGEGAQLFWIRALDAVFVAALVALSAAAARRVFPTRRFPRLAVPALTALLPQDAYYSISGDVVSPLVFGVAFVCLLELARAAVPDVRVAALAGLALAAAGLTRTTNLPLLAVAAGAVAIDAARRAGAGRLVPALPALASSAPRCRSEPGWCAISSCSATSPGFAASLAFLAVLSVAFDFGTCFYPSRDHPFFTSGRYLSGALIPFALLYVAGLDALFARVRGDALRFAELAAILLFATISEAAVNRVAFASEYNAFALWRAR